MHRQQYGALLSTAAFGLLNVVFATCALFAADPKSEDIVINGKMHSPKDIMAMVERSQLSYTIDAFADSLAGDSMAAAGRKCVYADRYVEITNGHPTLHQLTLNDSLHNQLTLADSAFHRGEFDSALIGYRRVYKADSTYTTTLGLIGDAFYSLRKFDSAAYYFRRDIARNFIDYDAHWFLADALWQLGDQEGSVREMTIAHILNFYHVTILAKLKVYRKETTREWKDWSFEPRYAISLNAVDSHKVDIRCDPKWVGYALAKALWRYEPGYSEKMLGHVLGEDEVNLLGEMEALLCGIAGKKEYSFVEGIILDGYAEEFVLYEILARQAPTAIASLPKEKLIRMAEYLDRYH